MDQDTDEEIDVDQDTDNDSKEYASMLRAAQPILPTFLIVGDDVAVSKDVVWNTMRYLTIQLPIEQIEQQVNAATKRGDRHG